MITPPNRHLVSELEKYRVESNKLFYSLSRILITAAVLFLTISPNFLGSKLADNGEKELFLSSFGLALASLFAGIAQFYVDWRGFREYTEYMVAITYFYPNKLDDKQKGLVEKYGKMAKDKRTFNTGEHWMIVQLLTISFSFVLLFVVLVRTM